MRWFDTLPNFGGEEKTGGGPTEPRPSEPKRPDLAGRAQPVRDAEPQDGKPTTSSSDD